MKSTNNIQIHPKELLALYLEQKYEQLSVKLLEALEHFENITYFEVYSSTQYNINVFVKHFLYLFTQTDYILSDYHAIRFVKLNPIISNLVAISNFKTTDIYLEILKNQPHNFSKILTLYSARNTIKFNYQELFEANSQLTCLWYSSFYKIYHFGMVNKEVYQNLKEHLKYKDDKLTDFYNIHDIYFGCTYIDGHRDQEVKQKINQALQKSPLCKSCRIKNIPDPKKVAMIASLGFSQHSVYHILNEFAESLKDEYEITLVHSGGVNNYLDVSSFKAVKYVPIIDGSLSIASLQENDFMVVYYPEVGRSSESIFLSNLRLAPIQICGLGHPVSTFGSEVDYFISGANVENLKNAQSNYSERLVLLPGFGIEYKQPNYQIRNIKKNKPEFIINCLWYSQSFIYPMIYLLKKVAGRDGNNLLFRFFCGNELFEANTFIPLIRDLEAILGKHRFEVIFNQPYDKYMALMEEGDICLDSWHFGGSSTITDSLYLRKPTVTFEGDKWYNRVGSQMLRVVGLEELIAINAEEYMRLTLKLIHNEQYRLRIENKLKQVDLNRKIFNLDSKKYLKKAIDFLVENHKQLKCDSSRSPILIQK